MPVKYFAGMSSVGIAVSGWKMSSFQAGLTSGLVDRARPASLSLLSTTLRSGFGTARHLAAAEDLDVLRDARGASGQQRRNKGRHSHAAMTTAPTSKAPQSATNRESSNADLLTGCKSGLFALRTRL